MHPRPRVAALAAAWLQLGWAPIDGVLPGARDMVTLSPLVGYRVVP